MTKEINKPAAKAPQIEVLGLWGFAIVCVKVVALTAAIVLLLKYVFGVPVSL